MICPKCGAPIPEEKIREEFGRRGGKKSRRTLTPEQARAMVEARERKRHEREINR
jgi:hypothetical protein